MANPLSTTLKQRNQISNIDSACQDAKLPSQSRLDSVFWNACSCSCCGCGANVPSCNGSCSCGCSFGLMLDAFAVTVPLKNCMQLWVSLQLHPSLVLNIIGNNPFSWLSNEQPVIIFTKWDSWFIATSKKMKISSKLTCPYYHDIKSLVEEDLPKACYRPYGMFYWQALHVALLVTQNQNTASTTQCNVKHKSVNLHTFKPIAHFKQNQPA